MRWRSIRQHKCEMEQRTPCGKEMSPGWPIRGFGLRSRYATLRYVEAA